MFGVGYHDNGCSLFVQFGKQLHYFGTVLGVQVTSRLIGKDDLRVGNNGTGDSYTLLLTSGELLWEVSGTVADVHTFQDIVHHLFAFGSFYFQVSQRQFHILVNIQFVDQVEALEYETDITFTYLCTFFLFQVTDFLIDQIIISGGRIIQ